MNRDRPLTAPYRKDARDEEFLDAMNESLASLEARQHTDSPERFSTIQVVSVPRSGSTLLVQLIASGLDVGYINNLIAAFWRAPVCGIRLSRKLLSGSRLSSFESEFGRTSGIDEPHEFGYFWSELLGYDDLRQRRQSDLHDIDWPRVGRVLRNICNAFGKPVVFKNFLVGWHVADMAAVLPKTCFVRVRRDPVDTALSLVKMRQKMFGSRDAWASVKPKEYSWLRKEPYWRQVAGQVYYLEKALDEQFAKLGGAGVVECAFDELLERPNDVLERVAAAGSKLGGSVEVKERISRNFAKPERSGDPDDRKRIERALDEFRSGKWNEESQG